MLGPIAPDPSHKTNSNQFWWNMDQFQLACMPIKILLHTGEEYTQAAPQIPITESIMELYWWATHQMGTG